MTKLKLTDKELNFMLRALICNYAEENEDFNNSNDIGCRNGVSDSILSKLFFAGCSHEDYYAARKFRYLKERINKTLFLGAGWHSMVAINNLHKRLNYAINALSGEQQNGGMGTEYDDHSGNEDNVIIRNVLKDIIFAFNMTPDDLKD